MSDWQPTIMKRVCWFSRYPMTKEHEDALFRVFPDDEQLLMKQVKFTASSGADVLRAARTAFYGKDPEVLAVVVPFDFLAQIMRQKRPWQRVFVPKYERTRNAETHLREFVYGGWEEVLEATYKSQFYV